MPSLQLEVRSLLSSFFLFFIYQLSAATADEPPLILQGDDGFGYFLVHDENQQPAHSADGSPLYEGRKGGIQLNSSLKSLISKEHLVDHQPLERSKGWIPEAVQAQLSPDALVRLLDFFQKNPEEFQKLFSGLTQTKVDLFKSILFERKIVLTSKALRELSRKAFSHPASIHVPIYLEDNVIQRKVINMITDIEGTRFTFYFRNKSIFFGPIQSKESRLQNAAVVNPKPLMKPGIQIHLAVQKAVLEGPTHDIGRFRTLWQYDEAWRRLIGMSQLDDLQFFLLRALGQQSRDLKNLLQFYEDQDLLIKGEIENLELTIGISFEELKINGVPQGLWKINIEEPLSLIADTEPKVRLWFEKRPPPKEKTTFEPNPADESDTYPEAPPHILNLPESAKSQIQKTLSSTLNDAFRSVFYASDLAFRIPLKAADYELQFSKGRSPDLSAPVTVDTKLAAMKIVPDGLQLSFDARLSIRELARCIGDSPTELIRWAPKAKPPAVNSVESVPEVGWSLESKVSLPLPRDANDPSKESIVAGPWIPRVGGIPKADLKISSNLIQLLNLGAYAGGLYCMSSRALWPRADYIPLISFTPTALPELLFSSDDLKVGLTGSLDTFMPQPPLLKNLPGGVRTLLDLVDHRLISMKGSIENIAEKLLVAVEPVAALKIFTDPQDSSASKRNEKDFSSEENDFVQRLLNMRFFSSSETKNKEWSYQQLLNQWFDLGDSDAIELRQLHWNEQAIEASAQLNSFQWIRKLLNQEPTYTSVVFSQSKDTPDLISTSEGSVELKWTAIEQKFNSSNRQWISDQVTPVFVSYRQRLDQEDWGAMSTLRSGDSLRIFLKQPGRYHFQLYAMNRSFEWLPQPVTYEVDYDPRRLILPTQTEKVNWKEPEASPQVTEKSDSRAHPTESSKGLFGCELESSESSQPKILWAWNLGFLIAAVALRARLRRYRRIVAERD